MNPRARDNLHVLGMARQLDHHGMCQNCEFWEMQSVLLRPIYCILGLTRPLQIDLSCSLPRIYSLLHRPAVELGQVV